MASYFEYFKINVEGAKEDMNSICKAIKNFEPYADTKCINKQRIIEVGDMCKIADEDDACNFAELLARAANGASFTMEGSTECSVSGERMNFFAECKGIELLFRSSDWYMEQSIEDYAAYESYEEYLEDCFSSPLNEEEYAIACTQTTFLIGDKLVTEVPLGEAIRVEY